MTHPKILLQLDPDPQPSVFDGVVAVDAGVDHLFRHGHVEPAAVEALVHGCIFTRGLGELNRTAIFIGGTQVAAGEALRDAVLKSFFGPFRVSVMLDANGANTTAAAAVLAAARHVPLAGATALVLAATGPVGQRVVRLLAKEGAEVRLASRKQERAQETATAISTQLTARGVTGARGVAGAGLSAWGVANDAELAKALEGASIVVAAGAAGVQLLPASARRASPALRLVVDLNAVPPLGIEGVAATDKAKDVDGVIGYGALGVGGTKMKIHRAALRRLFMRNDLNLDAEEILEIGKELEGK